MFKVLLLVVALTFGTVAFAGEHGHEDQWFAFVSLASNIQHSNPSNWMDDSYWSLDGETGNFNSLILNTGYPAHAATADHRNKKVYILGQNFASFRRYEILDIRTQTIERTVLIKDLPYSVRFTQTAYLDMGHGNEPWVVGWAGRWFQNEDVTLFAFAAFDPDPHPINSSLPNPGARQSLRLKTVPAVGGISVVGDQIYIFHKNGDLRWFNPHAPVGSKLKVFKRFLPEGRSFTTVSWSVFDGANIWVSFDSHPDLDIIAFDIQELGLDPNHWTVGINLTLEDRINISWMDVKHPDLLEPGELPHTALASHNRLLTFLDLDLTADVSIDGRFSDFQNNIAVTPTHPESILVPTKIEGETATRSAIYGIRRYGWFGGLEETYVFPSRDPLDFAGADFEYILPVPKE